MGNDRSHNRLVSVLVARTGLRSSARVLRAGSCNSEPTSNVHRDEKFGAGTSTMHRIASSRTAAVSILFLDTDCHACRPGVTAAEKRTRVL